MSHRGKITLRLRSPLPADECLARLREACDEEEVRLGGFGGYKGFKPAIARIEDPRFTLHQRFTWRDRRPPGASLLNGRLVPDGEGTIIDLGIRVPWALRITLLALFTCLVIVLVARAPRAILWPWGAAFLAVALAGHLAIDAFLIRRQQAFLLAFLRDTLSVPDDERYGVL